MSDRNFIGNTAAFIAAALFGASVVATRAAVGSIPAAESCLSPIRPGGIDFTFFPPHSPSQSAAGQIKRLAIPCPFGSGSVHDLSHNV